MLKSWKHAFAEPRLEHIGVIDINSSRGELRTWRQLNKVGTLGFFLTVPRQHFNLLNICDKAQLGHLLRDSTSNNTPADPAGPDQTRTPYKHSPRRITY